MKGNLVRYLAPACGPASNLRAGPRARGGPS
jgi:hypothetical protein